MPVIEKGPMKEQKIKKVKIMMEKKQQQQSIYRFRSISVELVRTEETLIIIKRKTKLIF